MFKLSHIRRDAATGEGGGGSAGDAGTGAAAGDAGAAAASSALAQGGGDSQSSAFDWMPEKYRVQQAEGGALDLDASARKLADGYAHLSKRLGSGDLPPETPDAYEFKGLADSVKIDDLKADPKMQAFLKGAHAKGMTNDQVMFAINEYTSRLNDGSVPGLYSPQQCTNELAGIWQDEAAMNAGLRSAFRGATELAKSAGIDFQALEASGLANNPLFVRMAAEFGKSVGEDRSPIADSIPAGVTVESLMQSEAYRNPRHPDNARVSAQVRAHFERKYGKEPVG